MALYPWYEDVSTVSDSEEQQLAFVISKNSIKRFYPLHHHDCMELSFVVEGYGYENVNGKSHLLQPGTVSILLPHHIHEFQNNSKVPMQLYCCMFDMNLLFGSSFDSVVGRYVLKTGTLLPSHYKLNSSQTSDVKRILDELLEEYNGLEFGKYTLIRGKLIEMLIVILRTRLPYELNHNDPQLISDLNATGKIVEIVQYLHLNYRKSINLKALSTEFGLSIPYISRLFKEQTSQNFIDYLHALRIKRALSLLAMTNMSILEISIDAGFEHISTFSRVFRETIGIPASEYRDLKRQSIRDWINDTTIGASE
ncbi:AraC family transcriptional regulator [Paenibacillus oceani]|uniref:Helix-turn-helix transcriptional regulator n=1 Tax=Paenibacillus oceani TaxID=2772510 RepID=A0A927CCU6_9BACL|nr:AraC family transcriptional regulator [Paenibacillus oceani]MBD2863500.1 helix-turn-helix transcriptional regulator [Paenibacillus oceani]